MVTDVFNYLGNGKRLKTFKIQYVGMSEGVTSKAPSENGTEELTATIFSTHETTAPVTTTNQVGTDVDQMFDAASAEVTTNAEPGSSKISQHAIAKASVSTRGESSPSTKTDTSKDAG